MLVQNDGTYKVFEARYDTFDENVFVSCKGSKRFHEDAFSEDETILEPEVLCSNIDSVSNNKISFQFIDDECPRNENEIEVSPEVDDGNEKYSSTNDEENDNSNCKYDEAGTQKDPGAERSGWKQYRRHNLCLP